MDCQVIINVFIYQVLEQFWRPRLNGESAGLILLLLSFHNKGPYVLGKQTVMQKKILRVVKSGKFIQ